jgi:hypothetical protein
MRLQAHEPTRECYGDQLPAIANAVPRVGSDDDTELLQDGLVDRVAVPERHSTFSEKRHGFQRCVTPLSILAPAGEEPATGNPIRCIRQHNLTDVGSIHSTNPWQSSDPPTSR